MKKLSIFAIIIIATTLFVSAINSTVFATQNPYKVICHHTPANEVTHEFANEQSYEGHLGTPHNNETFDTDGACTAPTQTPTPTPTPVICEDQEECQPIDVCPNIEDAQASLPEGYHFETIDEVRTCVPNPTETPSNPGGPGDGLGCAVRDCSNQSHPTQQVQGVLGASTMAAAGSFDTNLMKMYAIVGMFFVLAGYASYAKERRAI